MADHDSLERQLATWVSLVSGELLLHNRLVKIYASHQVFFQTPSDQYLITILTQPNDPLRQRDAALASIDPRYELVAAVDSRSGNYRVRTKNIDTYLRPKKPTAITEESIRNSGRGVACSKPASAYIFQRVR